ncbi:zinc ribbon domain-containing protein [Mycolicibacterium gadium]|uniref:Zinc ribbon domain-containing protein n=1 Tax=Mycolicibacterium gadium TaxID=1794 RepID=A0ABT6GXW0_MYCGU|nr:zinc ribbon domain-containing protein [Mycolicibacterium gadium]MDG5486228.1 zinc ribbon domain-containing protein [Mycolicibacterium gadium]
MTTPDDSVPTTECRICKTDVPDGEYCGLCGCHLKPRPGEGPDWLRIKNFGAAPNEHLLQLSLASSLFPQVAQRSRTAFRLGLVVLLVCLVAFTLLRLPAALITVGTLGLPVLYLIYLRESDAFRDFPVSTLVLTAVLGVAFGVGWVLLTGAMVARSYEVGLGSAITGMRMLRVGIGIPVGGVILMLMPAVIVRVFRPSSREALDGFRIGMLGAFAFMAAAAMTRSIPLFGTGAISKRPLESLLVEAGIRGISIPLITAAAGGLIGAALWFTRPASKKDQHPGMVRLVLVGLAAAILAVYLALGLIDVARVPQLLMLVLYLALALVAMLVLRIGLHLALLHEVHDEIHSDEPLLCTHCGHVVPDMAFCPACGVATRASSRSSREDRRDARPVREGPDTA